MDISDDRTRPLGEYPPLDLSGIDTSGGQPLPTGAEVLDETREFTCGIPRAGVDPYNPYAINWGSLGVWLAILAVGIVWITGLLWLVISAVEIAIR